MDEVDCVWKHGFEYYSPFLGHLNNFYKNIKFKVDFEENKLQFLGVFLIKRDNHLFFSIYKKATQKHISKLPTRTTRLQ